MPLAKTSYFEAEVIPGFEDVACKDIEQQLETSISQIATQKAGITFDFDDDVHLLLTLKSVIAVYHVLVFPVPRPRALLGHEHFHRLLNAIENIRQFHDTGDFSSFYISAAGSDSSVMRRLKDELAAHTQLQPADDEGDLLLRIRRTTSKQGWEVMIRLSPRPLATRPWRVQNMEGALNASAAYNMLSLFPDQNRNRLLNIGFGSGTFLIESKTDNLFDHVIGCDIDPEALVITQENIQAGGVKGIDLVLADAKQLPFASAQFEALCADLPFGQLVGSHEENQNLYPALLKEASRIARPNAIFILITHEIRLMEAVLSRQTTWKAEEERTITLSGLHPHVYVLRKIG